MDCLLRFIIFNLKIFDIWELRTLYLYHSHSLSHKSSSIHFPFYTHPTLCLHCFYTHKRSFFCSTLQLTQRPTTGQTEDNKNLWDFRVFPPKGGIYTTLPLPKAQKSLLKMVQTGGKARGNGWLQQKSVFQKQQDSSTCQLTVVVTASTGPGQVSSSQIKPLYWWRAWAWIPVIYWKIMGNW